MATTMKAININWDTDGVSPAECGLPAEVNIPKSVGPNDIADYLSDKYGYCVNDFRIAHNEPTPPKYLAIISASQFDESGEGMWLQAPEIQLVRSTKSARKLLVDQINEIVNYFTGREDIDIKMGEDYHDDDIEVRFDGDLAMVYYNSITYAIRLVVMPRNKLG